MAEHKNEIAQVRKAWMEALSAEQKTKLEEEKAKWANEEFKAERMTELNATFNAADTDGSGDLNEAELKDFFDKVA